MLIINNLTLSHDKDLREMIHDLNLTVNPGAKVAIIGEEGSGKSSLIKAIYQAQDIKSYMSIKGRISNRFTSMAYLAQELTPEESQLKVTDFLYQDLDYDNFDFKLFYQLAKELGLSKKKLDSQQTMASLSGGEKLKIQLLKLLAEDPELLLLDEPSADLDLDSLSWLENFIKSSDKTLMFISHDEALLENTATSIVHLEQVKKHQEARSTVAKKDYATYRQERQAAYDKNLEEAINQAKEFAKKSNRHHRLHQSVEHTVRNTHDATLGRLVAKKMANVLAQEKRLAKEKASLKQKPTDSEVISVFFSDIHPLAKQKVLLDWQDELLATGQSCSLSIGGQDKLAIVGKNGIGKSRLLSKIRQELSQNNVKVAYMPQNYQEELDSNLSALAFLEKSSSQEKIKTLLANLQFTKEEINHPTNALSGGQKAKLFLAKMILEAAQVLILDEPTRHFSPTSQHQLRSLFKDFPGAIIAVSHDRLFLKEIFQDVYELDSQKLRKDESF